jgi:hypothetical protein
MRSDFKTVVEALTNFKDIEDYFDKSKTYNVQHYMEYLRSKPKRDIIPVIEFVLKYMVILTDKKTHEVVEFDDNMLNNPRTLGHRYKIEKRKTRWKANRNKIWKVKDIMRLFNGIISDNVEAVLVLFDVRASIKLAKEKLSQSLKDWEDRLKEGFEYLPCDGTHKMDEITDALIQYDYFNQDSNNEIQCPIHLAMEHTDVIVSIKTSAHIDSWSENYLYSTYGVKPSDAAIRTGIIGKLRDFIKDMCDDKIYKVIDVLPRVNIDIHGDEQILAEWSYWWMTSDSPGSTSNDDLTDWYLRGRELNIKSQNSINKIVKYTKLFEKYASPTKSRFTLSAWWMWLIVCKSLEESNIKVEKDKWKIVVEQFVIYWNEMLFDKSTITIIGDSGQESTRTFKDFIGGLTTGYYGWFSENFKDSVVTTLIDTCGLIELDPKRAFTREDRWRILKRDTVVIDGFDKVRIRNNGEINGEWYDSKTAEEFIYVSVCDAFVRTDLYESDHKDTPHSKGGRTNWEDGELTTREYNNWKSNKMKKNKKSS